MILSPFLGARTTGMYQSPFWKCSIVSVIKTFKISAKLKSTIPGAKHLHKALDLVHSTTYSTKSSLGNAYGHED